MIAIKDSTSGSTTPHLDRRSRLLWLLFSLALALAYLPNTSEGAKARLADTLRSLGYEDVAVSSHNDTLFVRYENRWLRDDSRSLYQISRLALEQADSVRAVVLTLEKRETPLVSVMVTRKELLRGTSSADPRDEGTSRGDSPAWMLPHSARTTGAGFPSSLRKVDLVLQPQLRLQLGDLSDPIKYQFNLVPGLVFSPWAGGTVIAQLVVPLHNELRRAESHLRPGLVVFNQLWRLPWNTFLSISGGYFMPYRYGLDLHVTSYFLQGKLAILGSLGRTGYAFVERRTIYYSDLDRTTYSLSAWFRMRYSDLSVGLTLGHYLYGDVGGRADIVRRFGEFHLGFFALFTELGRNGGFTLSIPLPPRAYARPGRFRLRPARAFEWEYRYRGLRNPGKTYSTGFGDPLEDLDPSHVANQFDLFRKQGGR